MANKTSQKNSVKAPRPYDLERILKRQDDANLATRADFVRFFRATSSGKAIVEASITIRRSLIKAVQIKAIEDLQNLISGRGFYVILTDYPLGDNPCTYKLYEKSPLKAVYRGEGDQLKLRVKSHLFHTQHVADKDDPQYPKSIQFIEEQHVDVDREPYSPFAWWVVQYPLPESYSIIRHQMELAFDEVFEMPPLSTR